MTLPLLGAGPSSAGVAGVEPDEVAGLVGWWAADAIVGKNDGDAISQWDDASGATHHLVQATGGDQPKYKTDGPNSKPYVRCDGSDYIRAAFSLSQPAHLFVVWRAPTATAGNVWFDGGADAQMFLYPSPATTNARMYAGSNGPTASGVALNSWHFARALYSGASSVLAVDGGSDVTGDAGSAAPSGFTVGAQSNGQFKNPVDLAEAFLFDRSVAASQDGLIAYLRAKYGL